MRLDKFLKVSRLIKRRTVANEACDAGRVSVNGKTAKAFSQCKAGGHHRDPVWTKKRQGRSGKPCRKYEKRRRKRYVPLSVKKE